MIQSPFRSLLPLFVVFFPLAIFSCSGPQSQPFFAEEYDLILVDSFQVDYSSQIHVTAFHGSQGVFYNFREGSLALFDTSGTILRQVFLPLEGPNSLGYISGMKMKPNGKILLQTLNGEIAILNDSLNLVEKVIFPFASVTPNLRSNIKSLDMVGKDVYVYYPGRNGENPLDKGYFKKSHLLEMISLATHELNSVLKLSPDSKFNQDLYFEDPYLHVSILGDRLYLAFDSEPSIYEYSLLKREDQPITIPLDPNKFIEVTGQPIPLGNLDGVYPGLIEGIFPFESGFAVAFGEGLDKGTMETLTNINPKYLKSKQRNLLKIYHNERGWSNEIALPTHVAAILGFEDPASDFFALRNEELFVGNSAKTTIYRFRLKKKQ
ncbi:MAG TPA: hypothetical protein VK957_15480 [Lunatimonas sp.]|nr:hypothetical protein [Lunatimonas sp.]